MIIVDTSAWICLFENKPMGKNNIKAKEFSKKNRATLAVTDLIIEETHKWLVHHRISPQVALQILNGFVNQQFAQIIPIEPEDRFDAQKLVEKYLDQSLSYTDAVSVAVMKRNRIKQIFSFDTDFDLFRGIERIPKD